MPKRRAQGTGSIFKRTVSRNGKQYIYWCCEVSSGTDLTGKPVKKQYTFSTQAEAVAKLNECNRDIQEADYLEPSKILLSTWLDTFLEDYCRSQKYLTIKGYKAQINTHIKPQLGKVALCKLTAPMIQKFYNQLSKDGKTVIRNENGKQKTFKEGLSPKSIKNIHTVLNLALETAVKQGYLKKNPATNAILPKVKKPDVKSLTDEQVHLFIGECGNDCFGKMLKVILFTGMRESEALGLTWDCVDFKKGSITVNKQLVKHKATEGGYLLEETKNGKSRTFCVAPEVLSLLKERQKEDILNRMKAGEIWEGWQSKEEQKTALVFTNELGKHLTPKAIYLHCKKICTKINAPEVTVHGLRHTFATISLQNGNSIKTVSETLGHSGIAITADVYAHVTEQMQNEAAQRMQEYIQRMA